MNAMQTQLKALRNAGKPVLGCFPLYPPLELVHSMGIAPVVLWGFKPYFPQVPLADARLQNYACSVGRHVVEFVLQDKGDFLDGLLMYNACDTLRNLPEIIDRGLGPDAALPLHALHVPAFSMERSGAREYLKDRIDALIAWMESTFSVKFDPGAFERSGSLYAEMRRLMQRAQAMAGEGGALFSDLAALCGRLNFMLVEDQIFALEEFCAAGESTSSAPVGARAVISGILPPPPEILRAMEKAGLSIVENDLANMHRAWACCPEPSKDPASYYADFYENHFPCTTLLPTADRRLPALEALLEESGARALIFAGEKFCEYEYFELPYVEKTLKAKGIGVLSLEFSLGDGQNLGSMQTRTEAFAEMIEE